MLLVDREIVQQLVESSDPNAALVFTGGNCMVVPAGTSDNPDAGLLIVRRRDIADVLPDSPAATEQLDALAHRLDNTVRDLGG